MNSTGTPQLHTAFQSLDPDTVITLVEKSLGRHLTSICRPLASYINRVFELEDEEGRGIIVKFYRPGRWTADALQDEHDFLRELAAAEVPVIAPLQLQSGGTLGRHDKMSFAVFPKCGGRSFDEYTYDQWLELGRLIGRTHAVGANHNPKDRITLAPDRSTRDQVNFILNHDLIPADLVKKYEQLTQTLIDEVTPLFSGLKMIRLHGDCHFANLIYRPDESFYIIDFDDMCVGPPVQDFWMLLPDYAENALAEIEFFLEGYETFRNFDRRSLSLIEPLRAMRFIHYTAWCAHQVVEDGMSPVSPEFGSHHYWLREIKDLSDQLQRIRSATVPDSGNIR